MRRAVRTGLLKRLLQDRRGVSAIEFALIAPVMITIYFGLIEFSQGYMAERRAGHVASMVADLVAQVILEALDNKPGAARDIVGFNAGLAIYAGNRAASVKDGLKQAFELLASGAARAKLDEFCTYTRKLQS